MATDERGLTLTTAEPAAADAFNEAMAHYLTYRTAIRDAVKRALEADPEFVMGHCLAGYLFMLMGSQAVRGRAAASLAHAELAAVGATERERGHLAALRAWIQGDMDKAVTLWEGVLVAHPRDMLALRLQHSCLFWMGRSVEIRNAIARVIHAWDAGVPGRGFVLGMYAFGREESREYAEAEALGRQAVEANGDDLWGLHAVTHVLEMQGRLAEGRAWIDRPPDAWDDRSPFRGHLWWHGALFALDMGDHDAVLASYDRAIRPDENAFYLDVQNAVSILLRLDFLDVDVGNRWGALADAAEHWVDDRAMVFTDMHALIALAADGRFEAVDQLLSSMRAYAASPRETGAAVTASVALPLGEAIRAYYRDDFETAVDGIGALRHHFPALGGSHAQRDLFDQILIEAALKAQYWDLARGLLSERGEVRPHGRGTWVKTAQALEGLGDWVGATRARSRADRVAAG